jgi:hypothetical protein
MSSEPQGLDRMADERIVYLMRGLPSCGKSRTARRIAGERGVVCETDEFFNIIDAEGRIRYEYDASRLEEARRWNFERFRAAVAAGRTPIVVDRGSGLNAETRAYARHAVDHGYRVVLQEPDSPWWREIRELLKDKERNAAALDEWARRLSRFSRRTHRVPERDIRRTMRKWRWDVTVEDILGYQTPEESA